jgi:hypothetical protein
MNLREVHRRKYKTKNTAENAKQTEENAITSPPLILPAPYQLAWPRRRATIPPIRHTIAETNAPLSFWFFKKHVVLQGKKSDQSIHSN